ncbi:MAG: hypothetical protein JXR60_11730 [Bacteroidales bacterium]|nr:hypothetical protein [Bacteroidales bacterium]
MNKAIYVIVIILIVLFSCKRKRKDNKINIELVKIEKNRNFSTVFDKQNYLNLYLLISNNTKESFILINEKKSFFNLSSKDTLFLGGFGSARFKLVSPNSKDTIILSVVDNLDYKIFNSLRYQGLYRYFKEIPQSYYFKEVVNNIDTSSVIIKFDLNINRPANSGL